MKVEPSGRVKFSNYAAAVKTFTPHTFGKLSHGVNAVTGVLATLEPNLGTFHSGLPVKDFSTALLWQPRLGFFASCSDIATAPFPSWSWARWNLSKGCNYPRHSVWSRDRTYLAHVSFLLACDHKMPTPTGPKSLIIERVDLGAPALEPRPRRTS